MYSYGTYDTAPYDIINGGYDFGIKSSNGFDSFYYDTTVVNAQTSFDDVMALSPDGIFLSNGPGDPEPCGYAIKNIKQFLKKKFLLLVFV